MSAATTVGQRIRQVREARGMSQVRLADRAGLSKSFLSDLENDKTGPSGRNLLLIADVLGTSTDYLLRGRADETWRPDQAGPVEIPAELREYAEDEGLSFAAVRMLVDMHRGLIAMRSRTDPGSYDRDYWTSLDETRRKLDGEA